MNNGELESYLTKLYSDESFFNEETEKWYNEITVSMGGTFKTDEFDKILISDAKGLGYSEPNKEHIEKVKSKIDPEKKGTVTLENYRKFIRVAYEYLNSF